MNAPKAVWALRLGSRISAFAENRRLPKDAVRYLRADLVPQWVRCDERLPELGQYVLVTNGRFVGYATRELTRFSDDGMFVGGACWIGTLHEGITHWMPLPSPPDGNQETDK